MNVWPEPPAASRKDIVDEAHGIFLEYVKAYGDEHILTHGINFHEIYDAVIYPKVEVELDMTRYLGRDERGDLILGQFDPYNNIVYINKQLIDDNDPRLMFTIYHETGGHGVFHGPYLRKHKRNHPTLNTTASTIIHEEMMPFERQANTFAANLAAPIPFIRLLCKLHFDLSYDRFFRYIGPSGYCLNFMGASENLRVFTENHLAREIGKKIRRFFGGLSTEALSYQIEKAVIHNVSYYATKSNETHSTQNIGQCIDEYYGLEIN